MKKAYIFKGIFMIAISIMLAACAHTAMDEGGGDKLLYSNKTEPPEWIDSIREGDNEFFYFVGISPEIVANEAEARNLAVDNAVDQVVTYYGKQFMDKSNEIMVRYGISSDLVDPTVASRAFINNLSINTANAIKVSEIYKEKWLRANGDRGWKVYAECLIPRNIVEKALKTELAKARDRARKDPDKQVEEYLEFYQKMNDAGIPEM